MSEIINDYIDDGVKYFNGNKDEFVKYFKADKKIELLLSQSDIDILVYAINHINWNEYDEANFGGEGIEAACCHLDDFENQITD